MAKKCLMCHKFAFFNGKKCVCLRNYMGDGFNCIATSTISSVLAIQVSRSTSTQNGGSVNLSS